MSSLNLNEVILGGHLTSDPELQQTQSGIPVCSFSVAVNRRRSGEGKQEVDFINCRAWRATAEFLCRYFRKGSSVCIVGSIQTSSWTDQNNQKRYSTEVVADKISFVDSKGENSASVAPNASAPTNSAPTYIPDAYTANSGGQAQFELVDASEDLPF